MSRSFAYVVRSATGSESATSLAIRIERLTLEEQTAMRRGDWTRAMSKSVERTTLQEARHRIVARRLRLDGRNA